MPLQGVSNTFMNSCSENIGAHILSAPIEICKTRPVTKHYAGFKSIYSKSNICHLSFESPRFETPCSSTSNLPHQTAPEIDAKTPIEGITWPTWSVAVLEKVPVIQDASFKAQMVDLKQQVPWECNWSSPRSEETWCQWWHIQEIYCCYKYVINVFYVIMLIDTPCSTLVVTMNSLKSFYRHQASKASRGGVHGRLIEHFNFGIPGLSYPQVSWCLLVVHSYVQ